MKITLVSGILSCAQVLVLMKTVLTTKTDEDQGCKIARDHESVAEPGPKLRLLGGRPSHLVSYSLVLASHILLEKSRCAPST